MQDVMEYTSPQPDSTRWLTVIGMGEEGEQGLCSAAQRALATARYIFGAERLLGKISYPLNAQVTPWPSPLSDGIAALLQWRHTPGVVVLVSGDPFHYGLGGWLTRQIPLREMTVMPSVSSISLACARMGWLQQHTTVLSLHGRDEASLHRVLEPGQKVLVLTSDASAPHRLLSTLVQAGFGRSPVTLLEALGGPQERCRCLPACQWNAVLSKETCHPLNILALDVVADQPARCHGLVPGRPDDLFDNDGQITRSDMRAITLAHLRPHPKQTLWDLGAGSGAVAIEWLRTDTQMTALAVERHPARCLTIRRNAQRFGVPHLKLLEYDLHAGPGKLNQYFAPDAVFIGGGASQELIDYCMSRLTSGGRLVVNAVTLETEQLLYICHAQHGGQLARIAMEYAEPLGRMHGWKPARTLVQWRWTRDD